MHFGLYTIFLKQIDCGNILYGKEKYDYQEGTLVFFAPGQIAEVQNGGVVYQPQGKAIVFHPDLLIGTPLGKRIETFTFFGYGTREALHLSDREQQHILNCFQIIEDELAHIDQHSRGLIAANIELLLDYSVRYYDRQFITRDQVNQGIMVQFDRLLSEYFTSKQALEKGLPTVAYFAEKFNFSPNYFGDLIKKQSGKSAQEHLQMKLISMAKNFILEGQKNFSEIAYHLGFRYPQHFSRLFKDRVGISPSAFRKSYPSKNLP